jgi:hypothetical protein
MLRPCKPSSPSGTIFRSWRSSTVNRYSGFLDEFQHWQQRYHRPKPPQKTFYAGIIGLGCGIGTRKIARISRQISEPELENTVNWYFSPDATQAANDKVLHLMDRMELPNRSRRSQEVLHTSSDGQRFEVKVEPSTRTIRSNTSAKAKVLASTALSMSGTCCFTRQSSVPPSGRAPT